MAQIKRRGNILWIKYYDRIERKYKEFSTKEKATTRGYTEARRMLTVIEKNDEFDQKYGEMTKSKTFSEGFEEYLELKVYKENTLLIYKRVMLLFIEAVSDKNLDEYTVWDYKKFLKWLDNKEYTRGKIENVRKMSQNTKGIYTVHLKALFNYFLKRKYIKENFIEPVKKKFKKPEIIEDSDLDMILSELEKRSDKSQYHFIKFLLMTGFRRSTALELKWKDINFAEKIIRADNVKRDREFLFPLTNKLEELLREIQITNKNLHSVFNYSKDGLKFYWRLQTKLLDEGKISKRYTMHQLRKTFITNMLYKGIPLNSVKELADHRNINTTLNYYTAININKMRESLNQIESK